MSRDEFLMEVAKEMGYQSATPLGTAQLVDATLKVAAALADEQARYWQQYAEKRVMEGAPKVYDMTLAKSGVLASFSRDLLLLARSRPAAEKESKP